MDVYCIRHTSVDIKEGICYGQSDIKLKNTYITEKNEVQKKLNALEFDIILSSPLYRCRKLSMDIFPSNEIIFDSRLMEINFGNWEILTHY